jgi:hypothetical protein
MRILMAKIGKVSCVKTWPFLVAGYVYFGMLILSPTYFFPIFLESKKGEMETGPIRCGNLQQYSPCLGDRHFVNASKILSTIVQFKTFSKLFKTFP